MIIYQTTKWTILTVILGFITTTRYSQQQQYGIHIENVFFKIGPAEDGDSIKANTLAQQDYVRGDVYNTDFSAVFNVDSVDILILRGTQSIYSKKMLGHKIDQSTKQQFSTLLPEDKIIFYNIWCTGPALHHCKIIDSEITIKE